MALYTELDAQMFDHSRRTIDAGKLFAPGVPPPEVFFTKSFLEIPEKRFFKAMFDHVLHDLQRAFVKPRWKAVCELLLYVVDDTEEGRLKRGGKGLVHLVTFANICEELTLDHSAVARALVRRYAPERRIRERCYREIFQETGQVRIRPDTGEACWCAEDRQCGNCSDDLADVGEWEDLG